MLSAAGYLDLTNQTREEHDCILDALPDRSELREVKSPGGAVSAVVEGTEQRHDVVDVLLDEFFESFVIHVFAAQKIADL